MVGNVIGLVPSLVIAVPVGLALLPFDEKAAEVVLFSVPGWFTHVFGFVTGTLFLPPSYLLPRDPWTESSKCSFHGGGGGSIKTIHSDCWPEKHAGDLKELGP
jgi:hypothetical protein